MLAVFIAGGAALASVPVARVISTEPVAIDWIAAPARNFTPVGLGGDVKTGSASALLQFPDGTSVTLQANSELKIEGTVGKPVIRVITGSANYKLSPKSRIRIANGGGLEPVTAVNTNNRVNTVVQHSLTPAGAIGQTGNGLLTAAMIYKASPVPTAGVILPSSPILTGAFAAGKGAAPGFFGGASLDVTGGSAQIILPNNFETINLVAVVNPVNNLVTYTVASITETVPLSTGGTATITITGTTETTTLPNGTTTTVPVQSSPAITQLIGSTANVTPATSSNPIKISFTPVNATSPLSDTDAATAVQSVTSTAVTTAITNNQIPLGTQTPVLSAVQTGSTFSSSAP